MTLREQAELKMKADKDTAKVNYAINCLRNIERAKADKNIAFNEALLKELEKFEGDLNGNEWYKIVDGLRKEHGLNGY